MSNVDYYLFLDGVPGDAVAVHHAHEIDALGFSFEETVTSGSSGSGGGVGKARLGPLVVRIRTGSATPVLLTACASGKRLPTARLTCTTRGGHPVDAFVIELTDVRVSALAVSGPDGDVPAAPGADTVSLAYDAIRFTYLPQSPTGSAGTPVTAGWDVVHNRAL